MYIIVLVWQIPQVEREDRDAQEEEAMSHPNTPNSKLFKQDTIL